MQKREPVKPKPPRNSCERSTYFHIFSATSESSDSGVVENAILQLSVFATSTQIEDLLSKFLAKIAMNTRVLKKLALK